jgi:hypothetical protein
MSALKIAEAAPASADFVSTDSADLASHMHHCAISHSRLFPMYSALESAHGVVSVRIVTVAAIAVIAFGLLIAA